PLTIGGGIKTLEDIQKILNLGADKISINSKALEDMDFISKAAIIVKVEDGVKTEPFEHLVIDVPEEFSGAVIEKLGKRKAEMKT
ncbi:HisA/HisF-related TIM barrel protein, partial [Campylobacter coli]